MIVHHTNQNGLKEEPAPMAVRTAPRARALRRYGWLMALSGGILSACASYHPKPLHPRASAEAFAERRLDAPALGRQVEPLLAQPPASWPPTDWGRGTLLAVALVDNPALQHARAEVAQALAGEITARQLPNPTLGLQTEYEVGGSKRLSAENDRPWLYGVSFDIPLLWPLQHRLNERLAGLAASSARWKLMETTWSVRRSLIDALSDWRAARRELGVVGELLHEEGRLVTVIQRRVDAGEQSATALLTWQEQQAADRQLRMQAQTRQAEAHARVAAALGMPPRALDGLQVRWPDWGRPPPVPERRFGALREQALRSRADLAEAIDAYAISETRLQKAVARQYPQLHVTPGYYWDHGVHKFPLGFSLTLPIFNRNQGQIAQARAARTAAGEQMLSVQASIFGEIAGARRGEALAREQARQTAQRVELADRQLQRTQRAIQAGAGYSVQLLAARITALRSGLLQIRARARLQEARDALEDALRTPLSGPELDLRRTALQGGTR